VDKQIISKTIGGAGAGAGAILQEDGENEQTDKKMNESFTFSE
jgi:hypothetical protein